MVFSKVFNFEFLLLLNFGTWLNDFVWVQILWIHSKWPNKWYSLFLKDRCYFFGVYVPQNKNSELSQLFMCWIFLNKTDSFDPIFCGVNYNDLVNDNTHYYSRTDITFLEFPCQEKGIKDYLSFRVYSSMNFLEYVWPAPFDPRFCRPIQNDLVTDTQLLMVSQEPTSLFFSFQVMK